MRTLSAWKPREKIINTALDDLESFLWLPIWCIVHVSKDIEGAQAANSGIQDILDAWSGDLISNRAKFPTAQYDWNDAVFGDLIREWLDIFQRAHNKSD